MPPRELNRWGAHLRAPLLYGAGGWCGVSSRWPNSPAALCVRVHQRTDPNALMPSPPCGKGPWWIPKLVAARSIEQPDKRELGIAGDLPAQPDLADAGFFACCSGPVLSGFVGPNGTRDDRVNCGRNFCPAGQTTAPHFNRRRNRFGFHSLQHDNSRYATTLDPVSVTPNARKAARRRAERSGRLVLAKNSGSAARRYPRPGWRGWEEHAEATNATELL